MAKQCVLKIVTTRTMASLRSSYFRGKEISENYAKFRATLPDIIATTIIKFILKQGSVCVPGITKLSSAVDVGCGSGQSSEIWSKHFERVIGVDISESQIETAKQQCTTPNIEYHVASYDKLCPLVSPGSCELVACCQAVHWFDLSTFYREVDKVLVPGGVLAITLYQTPYTDRADVNESFMKFYQHFWDTGCWDERRRWIESCYEQVSLPYEAQVIRRNDELFKCSKVMGIRDYFGYITTMSAIKVYRDKYGEDKWRQLLDNIQQSLMQTVQGNESETLQVIYDYSLLMCRKP